MKKLSLVFALSLLCFGGYAQKKSLTWDDVTKWNRITDKVLSDKGSYIAVKSEPWVGESVVVLYTKEGKEVARFERGDAPVFVGESKLICVEKPSEALVDSLTLKKTKKNKMPKNALLVYDIATGTKTMIDSLESYKTPEKWSGFVAYKRGEATALIVTDFSAERVLPFVDDYSFAEKEGVLIYTTKKDSASGTEPVLGVIDLKSGAAKSLYAMGEGESVKQYALDKKGEKGAFVVLTDPKEKSGASNRLYVWNGISAENVTVEGIPSDWIVNENQKITIAEKTGRVYFGTSPRYPVKDTTLLERTRPVVDVWHWNEPKLHTQQLVDRARDAKRAYTTVWLPDTKKTVLLGAENMPRVELSDKGDGRYALIQTTARYDVEQLWADAVRCDIWLKEIESGDAELIAEGVEYRVDLSPESNYLYWYLPADSSWYSYSIAAKKTFRLTTPDVVACYDPSPNVPAALSDYGVAGWSEGDKALYVYDKHDIWKLSPEALAAPCNMTVNGARNNVTYRVVSFDKEKKNFPEKEQQFLTLFNNENKRSGYAATVFDKAREPKILCDDAVRYSVPQKAKDADVVLFTKETFEQFPDLYASDLALKKATRITEMNPQQSEFNWGTVEMISWVSSDGVPLRGLVFKPENFDSTKKYPMICNFYERHTDDFYAYKIPEAHRSTIDHHYYTSNGYVIFSPDIYYKDGYPGESCFNSLMPGIGVLLSKGYIDPKRIGAQGHSWGGYQVAYLATKTNLFAAIESGAPVVNMISAYGGIRWQTGLNRAFQYEHGQSRIGASIWEEPMRYIENSPIFEMDKVTTPILILHNDHDGHVPWWQGIEYFVALRRLQKPAWLLNYNDEPHWPMKEANKIDFQKRMGQFFDHYLKGAPMPEWMEKGVPATEKEVSLGYE